MSLGDERRTKANRELILLLVLIAIFHAAWVKFLLPPGELYNLDYAVRILVIGLFLIVVGVPKLRPERLGWTTIAVPLVTFVTVNLRTVNDVLLPIWPLDFEIGGFPIIEDPVFRAFDWSVGLALVAISEELVYRRLLHDQLERVTRNPWFIYLASALIFAECHSAQGPDSFAGAFYAAIGLTYLYRIGRSLLAPIVAHYLINLWLFSSQWGAYTMTKALSPQ